MRRRYLIRSSILTLTAIAAVNQQAAAQSAGNERGEQAAADPGRLVIIGGGLSRSNEAVYRAVLEGRAGEGPICVLPTATGGDPQRAIESAVTAFGQWKGAAEGVLVSIANPEAALDSAIAKQIRECSGFYFSGGVQSRIVNVFRPDGASTPALDALMSRFREGAVVAGSSAGAAIMSDPMIAGGSTTASLANGVHMESADAGDDDDDSAPGTVSIAPGIGFFRDAIVDQHFLARGRIGRMITAVLDLDQYDLGFGIDENTALVVDGDSVHSVGASGVIVVDARDARRDGRSAENVRLHLLGAGDAYDTQSRRVLPADGKTALTPSSESAAVPENIFARWAFLHTLHQFARSPDTTLALPFEGGELVLRKGPDFSARATDGTGVQDTPAALSVTGLLLDVRR
jgi:cyanophycinase